MKISGVDIRPGNIIEYEGGIWRAVKIQHTQPGKGGAYMQVEMKNLIDGRKTNVRFRSAETVERVRLDTKDFQFLFAEGDMLTFMDKETYEQISLPSDLLGDAAAFLQDGMDVVMELYDERPISVQLPDTIEAMIVEADAVVKGQTRLVLLQAGDARQWRARDGPAAHRRGHPDRRRRLRTDLRPPRRLTMVSHSGLITVMQRAARKAAPRLRRDFGEVEQLQVSRKGPADFVSMADKRAEQTIVDELRNARPDWGMVLEEGGDDRGQSRQAAVDRRSARWHHQLPPRRAPFRDLDRGRGKEAPTARPEITHALVHQPLTDDSYWAEKGRGAWLQDARLRVSARRDLSETPDRHRDPAPRPRRQRALDEDLCRGRARGLGPPPLRRRLARPRLARGGADGRLLGGRSRHLGHCRGRAAGHAKRAGSSPTIAAPTRSFERREYIAGSSSHPQQAAEAGRRGASLSAAAESASRIRRSRWSRTRGCR